MKNSNRYEVDPLTARRRRIRERHKRQHVIKGVLVIAVILLVFAAAFCFLKIFPTQQAALYKAPMDNPTFWFEQTQSIAFLTATPTASDTPIPVTPTSTLPPTLTPSPTFSPTPTLSPTPKLRPRKTVEGNAADLLAQAESTHSAALLPQDSGTAVPSGDVWFEVYGGLVSWNAEEVYPDNECSWMGVAGTLVDKRGEPQIGYYVQAGFADGSVIETLSGLFPGYGDSGYELTLARPVQAFEKPIWIQVLDEQRRPASERVYFKPGSDCSRSLTMLNFQRIR